MIPPVITTARLRLRLPSLEDAPAILTEYASDPEVTRFVRWRPHRSVAETDAFLVRTIAAIEAGTEAQWVVERHGVDRLIGMIGFRLTGHAAELGYVLARDCWGQGYATEAGRAVVDWALTQAHLHRVWAVCDVDHRAAARVLEKLGMEREGRLRRWSVLPNVSAAPRDCWCYARVK
jgi:RimJ/RimL family protein N-acetyltransferase